MVGSDTDTSLYEPFFKVGCTQAHIPIVAPSSDPSLSLTVHVLVKQPSTTTSIGATRTIVFLHGHPQSNLIWHRVIPLLHATVTRTTWDSLRLIIPDLRGHGLSGVPDIERDEHGGYKNQAMRERYSKRQMGRDVIEVAKSLGCDGTFDIVAHDRGARVSHRLALDYPDRISSMILLDIAPTGDMYRLTDHRFASLYWHWFFLIQPWPFPEDMIIANPQAYLTKLTSRFLSSSASSPQDAQHVTHPPRILSSYLSTLSSRLNAQATCEDYRASNPVDGIDVTVHDEQSRRDGLKIKCPLRVLWGSRGVIESLYGKSEVMRLWGQWCEKGAVDSHSRALECGHYVPEEKPRAVVDDLVDFFALPK